VVAEWAVVRSWSGGENSRSNRGKSDGKSTFALGINAFLLRNRNNFVCTMASNPIECELCPCGKVDVDLL
jgi:hypothetical protein